MSLSDLQKEKMRIRLSDPIRAGVIEMIIDMAQKTAKNDNRSVIDSDIITSVKRQIKETDKVISLVESKAADATKWKNELKILQTFLPIQMTEGQVEIELNKILSEMPESERIKKNQGKIMAMMKKFDNVDMLMVSKILNGLLH